MTLAVTPKVPTNSPSHTVSKRKRILKVWAQGTIITGINQSEQIIKEKSQNKHLRVFELAPSPANKPKLVLKQQKQIFPLPQPFTNEYYQRLTRFNPGGTLIAAASSQGDLSIVSFPALEPVYFTKAEDDIFSLDFSPADNDTVPPSIPYSLSSYVFRLHTSPQKHYTSSPSAIPNESVSKTKRHSMTSMPQPQNPQPTKPPLQANPSETSAFSARRKSLPR